MLRNDLPPLPPHEKDSDVESSPTTEQDGLSAFSALFFIAAAFWFFFAAAFAVNKGEDLKAGAPAMLWAGAQIYFALKIQKSTPLPKKIGAVLFALLNMALPPFLFWKLIL